MNNVILNKEVQDFINENLNSELIKITLKGSPFSDVSIQEIVIQIQGKLKAKNKLPTWFNTQHILYPPKIHLEQTSSEITAQYKSELVEGASLADLTGGFGVDSFYFSKKIKEVSHFETNKELSAIAKHNFSVLNTTILCYNSDGIKAIKNLQFDVVYIDPSRRTETKGKVFFLSDCLPNVILHLDYFLERCDTLMIKTSPMLDISAGLAELKHVFEIHIIAINNEVKEVLWLIKKNAKKPLKLITVNFSKTNKEVFETPFEKITTATYSFPKKYLYEPNAALMKSGMYDALCLRFPIEKLAPSSHLFTSNSLIDFPGRCFQIYDVIPYTKAEMKKALLGVKVNIATRNFPESVSQLKSKWKIRDGGDLYLFFTTDKENKKVVLVCIKIKI